MVRTSAFTPRLPPSAARRHDAAPAQQARDETSSSITPSPPGKRRSAQRTGPRLPDVEERGTRGSRTTAAAELRALGAPARERGEGQELSDDLVDHDAAVVARAEDALGRGRGEDARGERAPAQAPTASAAERREQPRRARRRPARRRSRRRPGSSPRRPRSSARSHEASEGAASAVGSARRRDEARVRDRERLEECRGAARRRTGGPGDAGQRYRPARRRVSERK